VLYTYMGIIHYSTLFNVYTSVFPSGSGCPRGAQTLLRGAAHNKHAELTLNIEVDIKLQICNLIVKVLYRYHEASLLFIFGNH
jgi:hypothetical protein